MIENPIIKTTKQSLFGTSTNTSVGKITIDEKGMTDITPEQYQELSHERYSFLKLVKVGEDDIKKIEENDFGVEKSEPLVKPKEEEIKTEPQPEPKEEEPEQKEEVDSDEEKEDPSDMRAELESMHYKTLQKFAKEDLGFKEEDIKELRGKDELVKFILDKTE